MKDLDLSSLLNAGIRDTIHEIRDTKIISQLANWLIGELVKEVIN